MRLLLAAFLLLACQCQATQWVIAGAAIETNGWILRLTNYTAPNLDAVTAANTNLQFNNGFTTNAVLSPTNAIILTLTDMGYNDVGSGIQVSGTIYGTRVIRLAYPLNNTNDIQPDAVTNCVLRLALSDPILTKDSNITMAVTSGAFSSTNGASVTNCMATNSFVVINGSTLSYTVPVANWTWPGWQRVSNSMTLRAVAFHSSARQGRPIRVMQFVAQDQHSHAVTNWVTSPVIDHTLPDQVPVIEYVGQMDISSFTSGDLIRCDFAAFPWVGDSSLTTFDNANHQPTPLWASITNVCDNSGAYGVSYAVVDPVNGGTGVVTTNFNASSPPATFANINAAASAINASNKIWFLRTNTGAGVIYLTNGSYQFSGASATVGNTPETWTDVTPFPGVASSAVIITNTLGSKDISGRVHLKLVTITATATTFDTIVAFWMDQCNVNSASSDPFRANTVWYVTHSFITNLSNGLRAFGSDNSSVALVRGNILGISPTYSYMVIGNSRFRTNALVRNGSSDNGFINELSSQSYPNSDPFVVAFNDFRGIQSATSKGTQFINKTNLLHGAAIVQNVMEWVGTQDQTLLDVCADGSIGTGVSNVMIWCNTTVGRKANLAYNETGSTALYRTLWSVQNNLFEFAQIKSDDQSGEPNGGRIGNWACFYGVGWRANCNQQVTNVGGGTWPFMFFGINSHMDVNRTTFYEAQFTQRMAFDGTNSSAGFGNYRLLSSSPLPRFSPNGNWLLPFDIEGAPRSAIDPPGAYSAGNVRKGAFF